MKIWVEIDRPDITWFDVDEPEYSYGGSVRKRVAVDKSSKYTGWDVSHYTGDHQTGWVIFATYPTREEAEAAAINVFEMEPWK